MVPTTPYEPAFGLDRRPLDRATAGRLSDWLCRIQKLSLDTMEFDRALQQSGRDVLFTDFGDHQPNLEGEVSLRRALEEPRYLTRFTIKGPGPCLGTYRPGKGARHQFPGLAAARARGDCRL